MPFGVSNSLGVFMEYMNRIFHPYLDQFVILFILNILIYSMSEKGNVEHLRVVLQNLKENKLYAKLSKCEFWIKRTEFPFVNEEQMRESYPTLFSSDNFLGRKFLKWGRVVTPCFR